MQYIDTDGTIKTISEETERKYSEQNAKWFPVEVAIIGSVTIGIVWGLIELYQSLPG